MDIRIGVNSYGRPVRSSLQCSSAVHASFAEIMESKKAAAIVNRDSVTITQKPLEQRLESVHQKIVEMDFSGKSDPEVYRAIYDAYEAEFGFTDIIFYTNKEIYNKIDEDRYSILKEKFPKRSVWTTGNLYYQAMGYDKMSDEEKVAAILKRINGNTYIHKKAILNELDRADVITHHEHMVISSALTFQAEKEYCEKYGIDYMDWKYNAGSKEEAEYRHQKLLCWMAETEISWLDTIKTIEDYEPMYAYEREAFLKQIEGTAGLLISSDKK